MRGCLVISITYGGPESAFNLPTSRRLASGGEVLNEEKTIKPLVPLLESDSISPISGVYRCEHTGCSEKVVWIRRGEVLPRCFSCGEKAFFILEEEVQHISEDPDFKMG